MKELSIEEKAKAYDKAKEKIVLRFGSNVAEEIFSEFDESEDEKIISAIRKAIKAKVENLGNGVTRTACLAWLEKQEDKDSQVKLPTFTFDDILALQCCMETVKKVQEDKDLYKKLNDLHGRVYDAYHLEKQGKPVEINPSEFDSQLNKLLKQFETLPKKELINSLNFYLNVVKNGYLSDNVDPTDYNSIDPHFGKPVDKVEPKFKVGDWVIDKQGIVHQVANVVKMVANHTYGYDIVGGGYFNDNVEGVRLWNIYDAKNGDILHSTGFHNDCIFIFNGLDNWKFDEPNGDRAVATGYCCLSVSADNMEFGIQGPDCVEVNTVKPATKIKRDLLFRKIKEAGYEWDAEKKELKKMGKKPTWSEEDKHWMQKVIDFMNHPDLIKATPTLAKDTINWLKSLKDRILFKSNG